MVFAANTVESGPATFAEFQRRALMPNATQSAAAVATTVFGSARDSYAISAHQMAYGKKLFAILFVVLIVALQ